MIECMVRPMCEFVLKTLDVGLAPRTGDLDAMGMVPPLLLLLLLLLLPASVPTVTQSLPRVRL